MYVSHTYIIRGMLSDINSIILLFPLRDDASQGTS